MSRNIQYRSLPKQKKGGSKSHPLAVPSMTQFL